MSFAGRGLILSAALLVTAESPAAEPQPADSVVRLVMVGDIMLDDTPGRELARGVDPFAAFAKQLTDADLTIGNLECVVAEGGQRVDKPYNFRAHPRSIPLLKKYFDAVSVANNHSGDFGPEALIEQCQRLEQAGLPYFGGGRNLTEAHRPWVVECKGLRIAILGYNEFKPRSFEAGPARGGVAWSVDERVLDDIRRTRSEYKADLVIPFMHWGDEEEPKPNDRQRSFARKMIDAGADLVVGGHPHITQGAEYHQGKLIVYSLGNYVFDGFEPGPCRVGWLLNLELNRKGLVAWRTTAARMDERGIPQPAADVATPRGKAGEAKIEMRAGP